MTEGPSAQASKSASTSTCTSTSTNRFTVTCTGTSTGTWTSTHKFKGSSQVLLRQSSKSCKSLCKSLRSLLRVLVMLLVLLEAQQVQQEPGPLHQHRPGPGQPPLAALLGLPMSWALHPCLPGPGQAGCQGSIVESRDSNGHITGSPGNVWDASPTNIARIEVLKVGVQSLVTLILPSIPCASCHIKFASCFSVTILTSTPFFPGQRVMSATLVLTWVGGSSQVSHCDRSLKVIQEEQVPDEIGGICHWR